MSEERDIPIGQGALLQRIGAEIVSTGSFSMDGIVFCTPDNGHLEVKVVRGLRTRDRGHVRSGARVFRRSPSYGLATNRGL